MSDMKSTTETAANNGPEHVMHVTFEGDCVVMRPECRAPETANCRLQPKIESQCQCASWIIERADDPSATPFHRAEAYAGAIHWMEPGPGCNVCDWINAYTAEEIAESGQHFTIGEFPIEPHGEGDHMLWRHAEPEAATPMTDSDSKETTMTTYTAEDFAKVSFARHPSGVVAARFYDRGSMPWLTADEISLSNYDMADYGWEPVREASENDGRVKRLKRHISDVEAVVKRRGEDIARLEAEKAELREQVAQIKAEPITLDALHADWENAEQANECNEGDILILRYPDIPTALVQVWRSAKTGPISISTRIHRRAPKREPWQDLADVLRAHTGEPDPEGTARMLHERGVRMNEEGDK